MLLSSILTDQLWSICIIEHDAAAIFFYYATPDMQQLRALFLISWKIWDALYNITCPSIDVQQQGKYIMMMEASSSQKQPAEAVANDINYATTKSAGDFCCADAHLTNIRGVEGGGRVANQRCVYADYLSGISSMHNEPFSSTWRATYSASARAYYYFVGLLWNDVAQIHFRRLHPTSKRK